MAGIQSLEGRILYNKYGKWLWAMRQQPHHAAYWLTGVVLPPHERFWMFNLWSDAKEMNVLASRGTSKSFTHASLAAPLYGLLHRNVNILTLSASGFRGGKELFKDAERLFLGQLKSQEPPGAFLQSSVMGAKVIGKDPSMWTIRIRSNSNYSTVPTNNPDQLRGLRSNFVLLDERAFIADEIPHKIIRPMLVVGQDFRRTAQGGDKNKMVQISTIDFTVRGWWNELMVAQDLQKRQYAAMKALKAQDWQEYDRLMNEKEGQLKSASFSYTRVDYSDLLIPERVKSQDGERSYKINYPQEKGVTREDILKYDEQDECSYWYTYPVDKKGLEEPLRSGTVDPEIWMAEQRNVPISSSGNVFSHDLISMISERPVWQSKDAPKTRRRKADDEDDDVTREEFYAPVLHACGDPCVLGVDIARESDETAFTVFRLGELAEGTFDPFVPTFDEMGRPTLGRTTWNHICWAESWKKMQAHEVAEKIRDLFTRFNIISTVEIGGIAMDKRGGGSAVRDELGNPKPHTENGKIDGEWSWDKILKMYDPEDKEGFAHYAAHNDPRQYWGGLRLVATTNQDNIDWTFGLRALMQQKKMYIAYWMPPSRWAFEKGIVGPNGEPDRHHPDYAKWDAGYNGIRRLKHQLLRLQTKVSELGTVRFTMPGDRTKEEGRKDLWASTIYGGWIAREHIIAKTRKETDAPMVEAMIVSQIDEFANQMPGLHSPFGW